MILNKITCHNFHAIFFVPSLPDPTTGTGGKRKPIRAVTSRWLHIQADGSQYFRPGNLMCTSHRGIRVLHRIFPRSKHEAAGPLALRFCVLFKLCATKYISYMVVFGIQEDGDKKGASLHFTTFITFSSHIPLPPNMALAINDDVDLQSLFRVRRFGRFCS
jgi:hypothetical protein